MHKTRGEKSSERKIIWYAFLIDVILLFYGIERGADLGDLGIALGAINTLPMSYVFGRSYFKSKKGESYGRE